MLASEIINAISNVERNHHGNNWLNGNRISFFQKQELPETIGVKYNEPFFSDFVGELENAIGGKIYRPTAKKILNNWYLWAKESL